MKGSTPPSLSQNFRSPLNLMGKTQSTIEHLLINLSKSNEARRRLANDVENLRTQLDEMADIVVKSKVRIGELEATNAYLHARIKESTTMTVIENLRNEIKKEVLEKGALFSELEISKQRCETLTNSNLLLQRELNKLLDLSPSPPTDTENPLDVPNYETKSFVYQNQTGLTLSSSPLNMTAIKQMITTSTQTDQDSLDPSSESPSSFYKKKKLKAEDEISLLKTTIENLKTGFSSRERYLREELDEHKLAVTSLRKSLLHTKTSLRDVAQHLCEQMEGVESVLAAEETDGEERGFQEGSSQDELDEESKMMIDSVLEEYSERDAAKDRLRDRDDGYSDGWPGELPDSMHSHHRHDSGSHRSIEERRGDGNRNSNRSGYDRDGGETVGSVVREQGRVGRGEEDLQLKKKDDEILELEKFVCELEEEISLLKQQESEIRQENISLREALETVRNKYETSTPSGDSWGDDQSSSPSSNSLISSQISISGIKREDSKDSMTSFALVSHSTQKVYDLEVQLEEQKMLAEHRQRELQVLEEVIVAQKEVVTAIQQELAACRQEKHQIEVSLQDFSRRYDEAVAENRRLLNELVDADNQLLGSKDTINLLQKEINLLQSRHVTRDTGSGPEYVHNYQAGDPAPLLTMNGIHSFSPSKDIDSSSNPSLAIEAGTTTNENSHSPSSESTRSTTSQETGVNTDMSIADTDTDILQSDPQLFPTNHNSSSNHSHTRKSSRNHNSNNNHSKNVNQELKRLQIQNEDLLVVLEELKQDKHTLETALRSKNDYIRQFEAEYEELKGMSAVEIERKSELNMLISQLEEKNNGYREELMHSKTQIALLSSNVKALEDRRSEWSAETFQLKAQLLSMSHMESRCKTLEDTKFILEQQLQDVKAEYSKIQEESALLHTQNSDLLGLVRLGHEEVERKQDQIRALEAQNVAKSQLIDESSEDISGLRRQCRDLESQLAVAVGNMSTEREKSVTTSNGVLDSSNGSYNQSLSTSLETIDASNKSSQDVVYGGQEGALAVIERDRQSSYESRLEEQETIIRRLRDDLEIEIDKNKSEQSRDDNNQIEELKSQLEELREEKTHILREIDIKSNHYQEELSNLDLKNLELQSELSSVLEDLQASERKTSDLELEVQLLTRKLEETVEERIRLEGAVEKRNVRIMELEKEVLASGTTGERIDVPNPKQQERPMDDESSQLEFFTSSNGSTSHNGAWFETSSNDTMEQQHSKTDVEELLEQISLLKKENKSKEEMIVELQDKLSECKANNVAELLAASTESQVLFEQQEELNCRLQLLQSDYEREKQSLLEEISTLKLGMSDRLFLNNSSPATVATSVTTMITTEVQTEYEERISFAEHMNEREMLLKIIEELEGKIESASKDQDELVVLRYKLVELVDKLHSNDEMLSENDNEIARLQTLLSENAISLDLKCQEIEMLERKLSEMVKSYDERFKQQNEEIDRLQQAVKERAVEKLQLEEHIRLSGELMDSASQAMEEHQAREIQLEESNHKLAGHVAELEDQVNSLKSQIVELEGLDRREQAPIVNGLHEDNQASIQSLEKEIEDLKDQIIELETNDLLRKASTTMELGGLRGRIIELESIESKLREAVDDKDSRIGQLVAEMEGVRGRVAELEDTDAWLRESLRSRVSEEDVLTLRLQLSDYEAEIESLQGRVEEMEGAEQQLRDRVQEAASPEEANRLRLRVEDLVTKQSVDYDHIKTLEKEIEDLKDQVIELETAQSIRKASTTMELGGLRGRIIELESIESKLREALDDKDSRIGQLVAEMEGVRGRVAELEDTDAWLRESLRSRVSEEDVLTLRLQLSDYEAEIESLQGRVEEMEGAEQELRDRVQEAVSPEEANRLRLRVEDLVTSQSVDYDRIKTLEKEIEDLKDQVIELETAESIRKASTTMELGGLRGRIIELEQAEQTLSDALQMKENNMNELSQQLDTLQTRETSFQELMRSMHLEMEELRDRVSELENNERMLGDLLQEKSSEVETLQEKNSELLTSSASSELELIDRIQSMEVLLSEREERGTSDRTSKDLQLEVEDLQSRIASQESNELVLKNESLQKDVLVRDLQAQLAVLEAKETAFDNTVVSLQVKIEGLEAEMMSATKELEDKVEEMAILREFIVDLEAKETSLDEVNDEKTSELRELRGRVNELERNTAYLEECLERKDRDIDELEDRLASAGLIDLQDRFVYSRNSSPNKEQIKTGSCSVCEEKTEELGLLRKKIPALTSERDEEASTAMLQTIEELRTQVAELRSAPGEDHKIDDRLGSDLTNGGESVNRNQTRKWWTLDDVEDKDKAPVAAPDGVNGVEGEREGDVDAEAKTQGDSHWERVIMLENLLDEKSRQVDQLEAELRESKQQLLTSLEANLRKGSGDEEEEVNESSQGEYATINLREARFDNGSQVLQAKLEEVIRVRDTLEEENKQLQQEIDRLCASFETMSSENLQYHEEREAWHLEKQQILNEVQELKLKSETDSLDLLNIIDELKRENEFLSSHNQRIETGQKAAADDSLKVEEMRRKCAELEQREVSLQLELDGLQQTMIDREVEEGIRHVRVREQLVKASELLRKISPVAMDDIFKTTTSSSGEDGVLEQEVETYLVNLTRALSVLAETSPPVANHVDIKEIDHEKELLYRQQQSEYEQMKHNYDRLLMQLSSVQSVTTTSQTQLQKIATLEKEISNLNDIVEKQRTELSDKDIEILNLTVERDELQFWKKSPDKRDRQLSGSGFSNQPVSQEEFIRLRSELEEMTNQFATLVVQVQSVELLETNVKVCKSELELIQSEYRDARVEIEVLNERLQEKDETYKKLKAELKDKKVELVGLMIERDELETKAAMLEGQREVITTQEQELDALRAKLSEIQSNGHKSGGGGSGPGTGTGGEVELEREEFLEEIERCHNRIADLEGIEADLRAEMEMRMALGGMGSVTAAGGKNELSVKDEELRQARKAIRELTERAEGKEEDLDRVQKELKAVRDKCDQLQDELDFANQSKPTSTTEKIASGIVTDESLVQQQEILIAELEQSLTTSREGETAARTKVQEIEDYSAGLRNTVSMLQGRCRDLENGAKELLQVAETTEAKISALETEKQGLLAALNEARNTPSAAVLSGVSSGPLNATSAVDRKTISELEQRLRDVIVERDRWMAAADASTKRNEFDKVSSDQQSDAALTTIATLNQRIEELEIERDGYKEMMMRAFDDSTTSDSKPATKTTLTTLMNNLNTNSNNKLQERIAELTKQNIELKSLERLRPQLMDLQQTLAKQQEESSRIHQQLQGEKTVLIEQNEQLSATLQSFRQTIDRATTESAQAKEDARQLAERVRDLEDRHQKLLQDLQTSRKELEDVRSRAVDPSVISEYEGKVNELMGERKHWQKKAQSLSKDMQRMINSSNEVAQLKEENSRLIHRVEELIAERTAFREAMQQTMQDVSPAKAAKSTPAKVMGGGGINVFKSVVGRK